MSSLILYTHLMCLNPLLCHFHCISSCRRWPKNSTYTAIISCVDKCRRYPRDGSDVRSSELIRDWLAMLKQSKGSLFFLDTPRSKIHKFTRPSWLIKADWTENSAVGMLVCMVPTSFMEPLAWILLAPSAHTCHSLILLSRLLAPFNLAVYLSNLRIPTYVPSGLSLTGKYWK